MSDPSTRDGTERALQALQESIRQAPDRLGGVVTLGTTGRPDDLYTLVDDLASAVAAGNPGHPCRSGCAHCCKTTLFRVRFPEWAVLRAHVDRTWDAGVWDALVQEVVQAWAPHEERLEALATFWSSHALGEPGAPLEGFPVRCVFLDGSDRCRVYEARPLTCRAFGAFGVTLGGSPTLLICQENGPDFIRDLEQSGRDRVVVPSVEPFFRKLDGFDPTPVVAPLPWWILQEARLARARG